MITLSAPPPLSDGIMKNRTGFEKGAACMFMLMLNALAVIAGILPSRTLYETACFVIQKADSVLHKAVKVFF